MKKYTIDLDEKEVIIIINALRCLDVTKENELRYNELVRRLMEMDL